MTRILFRVWLVLISLWGVLISSSSHAQTNQQIMDLTNNAMRQVEGLAGPKVMACAMNMNACTANWTAGVVQDGLKTDRQLAKLSYACFEGNNRAACTQLDRLQAAIQQRGRMIDGLNAQMNAYDYQKRLEMSLNAQRDALSHRNDVVRQNNALFWEMLSR